MFTLDLFSLANAANAVQDQQKQKILEKNFFRDAGNSADVHFSVCIENTVLVYNHIRHHRQNWLAKSITISHVSLPNFSAPFFYRGFTMYMRKGRKKDYNVFFDVDLCCISTVQTNGAQKGSSQNGTCACSTTHWPWPWVLKYSYLLSMSLAYKQLFLLL